MYKRGQSDNKGISLCRVLDGTKAVQVFGKVDSALQQLLLPSVLT